MTEIPTDQTILGLKIAHLIAGGFGGLARALITPKVPIPRKISGGIVGALVAGYSTPVASWFVSQKFGVPEDIAAATGGTVGFTLGLIGMSICETVIRWAAIWRNSPPPGIP